MLPVRKMLPHGVHDKPNQTTVVFVTICTEHRQPWLAIESNHEFLKKIWLETTGWLVGPYVIMPDHIHFFATRGNIDSSLEQWNKYCKRQFSLSHKNKSWKLMDDQYDRRIRSEKDFTEKWEYMLYNPVRKGYVSKPEDWPYQGVIHDWIWMNT
jgi:putative transposase